jgi:uroporphyrinogen decarboxylase
MPKETMTSRERWLCTLQHEKPDRLPTDYWATPETDRKLIAHLRCDSIRSVYEKLHIDHVVTIFPNYVGPPIPLGFDVYGCRYEAVSHGGGVYLECVDHPLASFNSVEEIERNYAWPSPDWFDYSSLRGATLGKGDLPIRAGGSEPFLTYQNLRGMEQAYLDLSVNPEMVSYCLDRLFGLCYEVSHRIYEEIPSKVLLVYVSEDFGSQRGLLMSPRLIKDLFIPRMKRMIDLAHQAGAYVFTHSDGAIQTVIPELVRAGTDILNPIQWRCEGMDRRELKRDFGNSLVFHGGMDNQYTLPFGTVEEVRREVLDNIQILGDGGGYILAPCHNIQVVTPPENIVAMYEAAFENGWF